MRPSGGRGAPEPPVTGGEETFGPRTVLLVSAYLWVSSFFCGLIVALAMLSFHHRPNTRPISRSYATSREGPGRLLSDSISASGVATDGCLTALGSDLILTHCFFRGWGLCNQADETACFVHVHETRGGEQRTNKEPHGVVHSGCRLSNLIRWLKPKVGGTGSVLHAGGGIDHLIQSGCLMSGSLLRSTPMAQIIWLISILRHPIPDLSPPCFTHLIRFHLILF